PGVYLRFDHRGKRTPMHTDEGGEGVWLRLYNNTKGAIGLCTESMYVPPKAFPLKLASGKVEIGLRDGAEASVCYDVEESGQTYSSLEPGRLEINPDTRYTRLNLGSISHTSFKAWVPSGQSIIIDLPKEHLSERRRIAIPFDFDWEVPSPSVA